MEVLIAAAAVAVFALLLSIPFSLSRISTELRAIRKLMEKQAKTKADSDIGPSGEKLS